MSSTCSTFRQSYSKPASRCPKSLNINFPLSLNSKSQESHSTAFNLNLIPFNGLKVNVPPPLTTSFGSAISISKLPHTAATNALISALANFSPIQLLGP